MVYGAVRREMQHSLLAGVGDSTQLARGAARMIVKAGLNHAPRA
jgi:hypothetical protein